MMEPSLHHVIRFTGKISWQGRANGLPEKVHAFLFYQEYNRELFQKAIDDTIMRFAHHGGMDCQTVQGDIIDLDRMPQDFMFVPIQWIVSIKPEVIHLSHPLSLPDENNVERLPDGTEPQPQ